MQAKEKRILVSDERLEEMAAEGARMIEEERAKGPDPNSALIWFPKIRDAGLPVPLTEFVEFHPDMLWPICDGKPPREDFPMAELKKACRRVGYPVFIRTDLSSAKHDGPSSFMAKCADDLWRCVGRTFEDNACKDLASLVRTWMVREWLDIDSSFTAFGGLKIGREWRFFAGPTGVCCRHFYWPEKAISGGFGVEKGWRKKHAILSRPLTDDEDGELSGLALRAARAIKDGEWSVDFAQDIRGKWWLIDMARAESSWHPKHAPQRKAKEEDYICPKCGEGSTTLTEFHRHVKKEHRQ